MVVLQCGDLQCEDGWNILIWGITREDSVYPCKPTGCMPCTLSAHNGCFSHSCPAECLTEIDLLLSIVFPWRKWTSIFNIIWPFCDHAVLAQTYYRLWGPTSKSETLSVLMFVVIDFAIYRNETWKYPPSHSDSVFQCSKWADHTNKTQQQTNKQKQEKKPICRSMSHTNIVHLPNSLISM